MAAITAKKSYKDGCVTVRVVLKSRSWQGDSAKVEGSTDMTSREARELAAALAKEADRADAKVKAKAESEARRQKYRDREIAAGQLVGCLSTQHLKELRDAIIGAETMPQGDSAIICAALAAGEVEYRHWRRRALCR